MLKILNKIPKWLIHTFVFFVVSRIFLLLIGLLTIKITAGLPAFPSVVYNYTNHNWLNLWGHWDTGWYTRIAQSGYSASKITSPGSVGQADYAFFPLYPELMGIIGKLINNYYIAGLIISNISLFVACYFLYKITLLDNDESTALRSIKYLIFFPTAFLFSSVLTESLFLMLTLGCFYFCRKDKYFLAGILGGLSALTRSIGVFVLIPCLIEFLSQQKKKEKFNYSFLWLILIPLGLFAFMFFNYKLTGDFLAFSHVETAWGRSIGDPLRYLAKGLLKGNFYDLFNASAAALCLSTLIIFYKKFSFSELVIIFYSIVIPLSTGLTSMPRYILAAFPIYILCAKISKNPLVDNVLMYSFVVIQGFLMVFWVMGTYLVM